MIDFLLSRSAVDAVYIPALTVAVLLLATPTRDRPQPLGIALAIGFLTGFMLVRPLPLLPPIGTIGWLPAAAVAGLVVGLFADRPRYRLAAGLVFVLALPPAILLAVGIAGHAGSPGQPSWLLVGLLAIAGMVAFARLGERAGSHLAFLPLIFASAGLATLTGLYGSRLALHAITLCAVLAAGAAVRSRLGLDWPRSASFAAAAAWFALFAATFFSSSLMTSGAILAMLPFFIPGLVAGFAGRRRPPRLRTELLLSALTVVAAGLAFRF